jgi:hypothetical protein
MMGTVRFMRDIVILAAHPVVTFRELLRPGGIRAVAAESLLLKHQTRVLRNIRVSRHSQNYWRRSRARQ